MDGRYKGLLSLEERQRLSRRLLALLWPGQMKGRRNYRSAIAGVVLAEEWSALAQLLRQRARVSEAVSTEEARNRRRSVKKIQRALRRIPGQKRAGPLNKALLIGRMRPNPILDSLVPDRASKRLAPQKRATTEYQITLSNFSLISNPSDTFIMLREIALCEATALRLAVNFTDAICFDVSAYLVLGLMREDMLPVFVGGSITATIRSMVSAVSLNKFLRMGGLRKEKSDPSFLPFHLRHSKENIDSANIAFQPSAAEKLVDDLNDTISSWLRMLRQQELSVVGKAHVARLISEALDNAQRHSDLSQGNGNWAIAGFLSAAEEVREHGNEVSNICSLAIVSLGASISESISVCVNENTKKKMESYVALHARTSKEGPAPDVLRTIYALQDGVSRFAQGDDDAKGGVGLMDIIQFVRELSTGTQKALEMSCVTIISGSSCLSVRSTHADMAQRHPSGARQIWFNAENSLVVPPDPEYAFSLPVVFPGTIVALRFCVSQEVRT